MILINGNNYDWLADCGLCVQLRMKQLLVITNRMGKINLQLFAISQRKERQVVAESFKENINETRTLNMLG